MLPHSLLSATTTTRCVRPHLEKRLSGKTLRSWLVWVVLGQLVLCHANERKNPAWCSLPLRYVARHVVLEPARNTLVSQVHIRQRKQRTLAKKFNLLKTLLKFKTSNARIRETMFGTFLVPTSESLHTHTRDSNGASRTHAEIRCSTEHVRKILGVIKQAETKYTEIAARLKKRGISPLGCTKNSFFSATACALSLTNVCN